MTKFTRTRHAEKRMRQRGLRDTDIPLMMNAATALADDALLMTNADIAREIAECKRKIQQLERLRGVVVVAGRTVVTAYHSRRSNQRRALRRAKDAGR